MSQTQIPVKIVKNAIRSAICIDDNYAAPYKDSEGLEKEEPEKLYYSFRKEGQCDLDIYRFQGLDEWNKHKHLLCNKDLMVLDWELNQSSVAKYLDTLNIMEQNIRNKNVPFVVIYTKTPNLDDVSRALLKKFNKYDLKSYDDLIKLLFEEFKDYIEEIDELELFLEKKIDFFFQVIKSHDKREELFSEFRNEFFQNFQIKEKFISAHNNECHSKNLQEKHLKRCLDSGAEKFDKKCPQMFEERIKKIGGQFQECNNHIESFIQIANISLCNETKEGDSLNIENNRIHIDKHCYSLDGIIVLILHKDGEENGVKPSDLFNVFSEAITSNPHNLIHLISLELRDKFRNDFSTIGTKFNTVDEKAFLHHAKNYEKDGIFNLNSFRNFVVKSWIHELFQYNLDLNLESFDLIGPLIKEHNSPDTDQFYKALVKYAAMVSGVYLKKRSNFKLGFGNLFKNGESFFLCITPHCDCLRPDKINNQFYFIKGQKSGIETALKKAETEDFSFCIDQGHPIAIEWECKPFSSYISDDSNAEEEKVVIFKNEQFPLKFICTIKENYTQRISNNSFGYGYRIGIDLPHLKNY